VIPFSWSHVPSSFRLILRISLKSSSRLVASIGSLHRIGGWGAASPILLRLRTTSCKVWASWLNYMLNLVGPHCVSTCDIPMLNAVILHCISMQHWTLPDSEIGHVTAEKQTPSAIDFLANIRSAIDMERRIATAKGGTGSSRALKDVLGKVVSDYNKLVTVKKHRIDSGKRALCYNMLLVRSQDISCFSNMFNYYAFTPGEIAFILKSGSCFKTYCEILWTSWGFVLRKNFTRSSTATMTCTVTNCQVGPQGCVEWAEALNLTWPGIPLDILQHDHWVPGSTSRADLGKYQNKPLFKEILTTSASTCILYAKRATEDILCCSISWQSINNNCQLYPICNSLWGLREKGFQGCIV